MPRTSHPLPDCERLLITRNLKPDRGGRMRVVKNWMAELSEDD